MNIVTLYRRMLPLFGLAEEAKNGPLCTSFGSKPISVKMNKKKVVLPAKDNLTAAMMQKYQIFHPAGESVLMGPSLVMRNLVKTADSYYSYRIPETMVTAINALLTTNLATKDKVLLAAFGDVNKKDLSLIKDAMVKSLSEDGLEFVKIRIATDRKVFGRKFKRVCIVKFPLYEEALRIVDEDLLYEINDRKWSKRAVHTLIKAYEAVLPSIKGDGYSRGGVVRRGAPFLQALTEAVGGIATELNVFAVHYSTTGTIDTEFYDNDRFSDDTVKKAIGLLPDIEGNVGSQPASSTPTSVAAPVSSSTTARGQFMEADIVEAPAPVVPMVSAAPQPPGGQAPVSEDSYWASALGTTAPMAPGYPPTGGWTQPDPWNNTPQPAANPWGSVNAAANPWSNTAPVAGGWGAPPNGGVNF